MDVSSLFSTINVAFFLLLVCNPRRFAGSSSSSPLLSEASFSVPAGIDDPFPWGPTNIGRRSCPVRYPWSNETNFCLSVGRQRAIVNLPAASPFAGSDIACTTIQWRLRSDIPHVDSITVFVTTPAGNFTPSIKSGDRIEGEVCFETVANVTSYALYYLPIAYALDLGTGSYHSHFLTVTSPAQVHLDGVHSNQLPASSTRNGRLRRALRKSVSTIPAQFVRFESRSSHDVRSAMEFSASRDEVVSVLNQYPSAPYLTWVSLIENTTDQTIRMNYDLPLQLIETPPNTTVSMPRGDGVRIVQVILYAAREHLRGVVVDFPSASPDDVVNLGCIQTTGTNYRGEDMIPPPVELDVGQVGQLMIMVDAKESIETTRSAVTRLVRILPIGLPETSITVNITSTSQSLNKADSSDVWRLSRLKWLDSKTGLDQAKITRPYTPIVFNSSNDGAQWILECRGRTITVCKRNGLPVSILSNGRSILSSPMTFELTVRENKVLDLIPLVDKTKRLRIHFGPNNASAWWKIPLSTLDQDIKSDVTCLLTYDGHLDYSIAISSASGDTIELDDASLKVNVEDDIARFAVGGAFGSDGDWFPSNASRLDWSWNETSSGWRLWLGDVDAGLYMKLKGVEDAWNEANPIGAHRPLSWSGTSGNTGGIKVSSVERASIRVVAFSGPLRIQESPLIFNFSLIASPTKGDYIHTVEGKREHYKWTRHFHVPYGQWEPPPDPCNIFNTTLSQPTTLILHQSNRLNPYINWPFHPNVVPELTKYVREARVCGVAVKIYYTVHELTNHCVELHALSGLNGEILLRRKSDRPPLPGPGITSSNRSSVMRRRLGQGGDLKGNEWLLEHLVHGYEGAWFTLNPGGEEDAAVFDNVTSRFLNYYIEGQRWLYENVGIAGLYYDGFNSERRIQQRIRRMSEEIVDVGTVTSTHQEPHAVRFDVHGRAFEYTELLPYVDSMWTAEGIDFSKNPAYWLISISALPFGVYGEMLGADAVHPVEGHFCGESCANRFRGMLFGMTNRAGWNGKDPNDNLHLWRLWDDIAMDEAELFGWWNRSCPVRVVEHTGGSLQVSKNILATAYVRPGKLTLVAIASWDASNRTVALEVDWDGIGLDEASGQIKAPRLPSFNRANRSILLQSDEDGLVRIKVPAYEGWLLVISK